MDTFEFESTNCNGSGYLLVTSFTNLVNRVLANVWGKLVRLSALLGVLLS